MKGSTQHLLMIHESLTDTDQQYIKAQLKFKSSEGMKRLLEAYPRPPDPYAQFLNDLNKETAGVVHAFSVPGCQRREPPAEGEARCVVCRVPASDTVTLMKCGKCKAVKYCSRDCQKTHWKEHRKVCKQV